MSLASEANKLGANLDCIPSFHRSSRTAPVPLELKGGFNALHPAQFFNQSQNMSRSPNHSPPHSPVPLQQEDSKSVHMKLHGDNSHKSSNESSSSSFTTQLPPEGSSTNTAGSKYLPQGEVTLMNHHHPNKQVDVGQPEYPHGGHIHNRNSRNETTSSVDRNDSDFDGFSYDKPKHKERTFHSEKPTSRPEDPLGLFSRSSECIDSHRGMSHAFSDSKLNENGGSSAYCSQEGMSPLSPLNFPKAQPPFHLSASQEKPLQQNENMGLVYPQIQYMLVDVDPTGSKSRLDLLNSSSCSEIPSWNKPIYKVTGGVDDKYPTPGKDFSKSAFITLNHLEKNSSTLETMERLDEKYPFLFGVDTSTQEFRVSGDVLPASSAIYFKPFVDNIIEHPKNFQVEKTPPDLGMSQRTANDQDCDLTTRVIGEQEKYISGFGSSEVAGLYPSARQQSYDLPDLMSGSIYGLASHAPPLFQPVGSQKDMAVNEPKLMSSIDLYPSAVHDDSDLSSNLNKNDHTLIGNPTEDALFMREFSLLDADFVSYPYQKVENLGYGGSVCEKSNVKDSTSENLNFPIKSHEKNQLESVIGEDVNETIHSHVQSLSITVPYILDETSSYNINFRSPAATEVEGSVIPEFESEDAKADDEDITYSISDAMIAEMEDSIYGLQEKGKVTLEYEISNTGGDVCHGTLNGDVVSFIQYDTIEKAQMSQSPLQRLCTAEFVNPLMVISSKPNVWLVVPKIDSTLDQFKKKNTGIWSCDDLLDDKYKIIVRDIIAGVIQLVNQGYMGELKIQDIAIINGRAKLMRISNELAVSKLRDVIQLVNQGYMGELKIQDIAIINGCAKLMRISNELGVSKLRDQLQNLLEDLLGNDPNNKELIDFYYHLKSMQMCKLIHLRNHPILLTSQERLQIPVLLPLLLKYEKKSSNWKPKYDRQYRDEEVKKAKRLEKDQEHKVVYEYKSDQKREVNYIATKVEKDQDYKNVYKYRIYPNTASSQIDLSRNIIVHINDDGQCRTSEEVGKKLKYFFPDLWTRLFSLMISEGIDI
ncbi:hypothetical protein CMV_020356 [Castanea mollissima]|uniref:Uncharacterized protein n=1 Tax=Castanea mollissima TaxID=60419 RepID=A0A8J4VMS8_9ROSI|nr:hypothetical protein CMV_020356 [Castanea mollissima]